MRMTALIRLLRPDNWVKNGVVLSGLIFGGMATHGPSVGRAFLALGVFCLLSSLVYIINDLKDREKDRAHPTKRFRPLASGEISPKVGLLVALFIGLAGAFGARYLGAPFGLVALSYIILNIGYTYYLKQMVIIDVMVIAVGFVLRAWAGALAINVDFDAGLFIMTFLLALFLGFGKRRHELALLGKDEAGSHRFTLERYSPYLLDQLIGVVTAAVAVTYILYVTSPEVQLKLGTDRLWITFPFVLYGIFRYLYLVHHENQGGSPTRIMLTDRPIILSVALWLIVVFLLLYKF